MQSIGLIGASICTQLYAMHQRKELFRYFTSIQLIYVHLLYLTRFANLLNSLLMLLQSSPLVVNDFIAACRQIEFKPTTARLAGCTTLGNFFVWYLRVIGAISVLPLASYGL